MQEMNVKLKQDKESPEEESCQAGFVGEGANGGVRPGACA
jgi:hypothetical protein